MKILALEFSSDQRSVAVWFDGQVRGEASEQGGRHTRAFHLIESALGVARIEREEIDVLCVGLGPGSYTGVRLALALVEGWQLARETRTLGVSSVEVLARQAVRAGLTGPANFVVDAQRGEFYLARYWIGGANARLEDSLRITTRAEVESRSAAGELVAGPDASRWFPGARDFFPSAGMLAEVAATRSDFAPAGELTPVYLRETAFVKAPPPRIIPTGGGE
ncbi:MAG TPA: tRNA (adenosine(37)-N6)-threonylcarbamoyltransferase complex dimerization subunit type 1 TsaB [Verrucomicrobiae bacterium]|nr:tRNA (adenosine(37)-N6)-threonylcarbamoyltransferase complex dimerization subunit type 1 TsaB [Verrucomicrobiae bacterium]